MKRHENPTPEGLDAPAKVNSGNKGKETPGNVSFFEPVQNAAKKLGPVPYPLNDVERTKLRLGLKIGLFFYQYTILL